MHIDGKNPQKNISKANLTTYKKNPKPIEGVDFFPEKTAKELAAEEKARKKKEEKAKIRANRGVVIRNGKIVKDGRKKKPDDDTNIEPVRFGPEDKESNPEDENN